VTSPPFDLMAAFREAAALQAGGDLPAAAGRWRAILDAEPASGEAWRNLAECLVGLDRFDEAEAAYRSAARLRPDKAWAHAALASFFHRMGRLAEAEAPYRQALVLDPDNARLRTDLGHLLLGLGRYAEGWPFYESRKGLAGHGADPLPIAGEWQGEPLAGKRLLIWPEQGFGDLIQFARFVRPLAQAGAEVTLATPPELLALFGGLGASLVERTKSMTLPVPDHWTMAMSIPYRLGTTLETLPPAPYLAAPADRLAKWNGPGLAGAVGVAWRGRGSHPYDRLRSLPRDELSPLVRAAGRSPVDLTEPLGDFADLAAVIAQLDLVITVDTAVAHLAGALGKPCWVLLRWAQPDWRWLQDRADSPWYESVRLFRQTPDGGWPKVLAEVAAALEALRSPPLT
jgi:tetratricopeptide (TPR) repeat protein